MTEYNDTYYIAYASCYEMKSVTGAKFTIEDQIIWLAETDDNHPQCCILKEGAKHFSTIGEIQRYWTDWDGMPWYYRLKPGSLHIIKVEEKKIIEKKETVVL